MAWFTRRRDPAQPSPLSDDELGSLCDNLGQKVQVIAHGRGRGVLVVVLQEIFCVSEGGEWNIVGWHEIHHGGWNRDSQELNWTIIDGEEGRVILTEPGDVPEHFLTQVEASIVLQQRLRVPDTSFTVVIAARRALRPEAPLVWTVQPLGSTSLSDERVKAFVIETTQRMADELEVAR